MKTKKKLYYFILGVAFGGLVVYNITFERPPNDKGVAHKKHTLHKPITKPIVDSSVISHVTLTCYQPVTKQCDNEPLTTSDGSKISLRNLKNGNIKWCAISQDLLYLLPAKKPNYIWIEGYGTYEVRDVMNKRFTHSVDLLIHPKNSLRIKKQNVKIKIYK